MLIKLIFENIYKVGHILGLNIKITLKFIQFCYKYSAKIFQFFFTYY